MGFVFDKIPETRVHGTSTLQFLVSELPNTRGFKLLSDAISKIDRVVSKTIENLQLVQREHNRESKRLALIRIEHTQCDKKIFEFKGL